MSRLALILETPMSLQPETCEHLAKDCLQAAERTEAPPDSRDTSQAHWSGCRCARSIEAQGRLCAPAPLPGCSCLANRSPMVGAIGSREQIFGAKRHPTRG